MSPGSPRELAILCIFEDRAFEDVALPLLERIVRESYFSATIRLAFTHGCAWNEVRRIGTEHASWPDLLVIGADTGTKSVARKGQAMGPGIARCLPDRLQARCLLALARPCAEGWLQADLAALKRGISDALGEPVSLPPDTGRYPRDERQAKDRLRSILQRADIPLVRGGLEFGPYVAPYVDFQEHDSLRVFERDLRRRLQAWHPRS